MTTVADFAGPGPRTHALLIGVGQYPHCAAAASGVGEFAALGRRFAPRSSPPRSALALAEWIVREQRDNPVAPLGTVELLASAEHPGQRPVFGGRTVEPPTFDNILAAFDRWFARCDADPDSIAMFFFSGHGCEYGERQFLLAEDVGASELRFFDNAIRFDRTYLGMARCRARTQCYLVDACRDIPNELRSMVDLAARGLIEPQLYQPPRNAPVIFAAAPGEPAEGGPGGVTPFTGALMSALDGAAAQLDRRPDRWEVTTETLWPAINRLLNRPAGSGPASHAAPASTPRGSLGGTSLSAVTLRALPGPPTVPFRLACDPDAALGAAHMAITRPGQQAPELSREPDPSAWEGAVRAAYYLVQAKFRPGVYADAGEELFFRPPYVDHALTVRRA